MSQNVLPSLLAQYSVLLTLPFFFVAPWGGVQGLGADELAAPGAGAGAGASFFLGSERFFSNPLGIPGRVLRVWLKPPFTMMTENVSFQSLERLAPVCVAQGIDATLIQCYLCQVFISVGRLETVSDEPPWRFLFH